MYDLDLDLTLEPIWHADPPRITVTCHDTRYEQDLRSVETLSFRFRACGTQRLAVTLSNKCDNDTIPDLGLDKAIKIVGISFFGITDPRFIWLGQYRPHYPEPWASQQLTAGHALPPVVNNIDRLGWNGTWWLDFDLPVFTWIHQVQDLGWLHR